MDLPSGVYKEVKSKDTEKELTYTAVLQRNGITKWAPTNLHEHLHFGDKKKMLELGAYEVCQSLNLGHP